VYQQGIRNALASDTRDLCRIELLPTSTLSGDCQWFRCQAFTQSDKLGWHNYTLAGIVAGARGILFGGHGIDGTGYKYSFCLWYSLTNNTIVWAKNIAQKVCVEGEQRGYSSFGSLSNTKMKERDRDGQC
jgi:hypothetical protein